MMKTSGLRRLLGSVLTVAALLAAGSGAAQPSFPVSGKVTDSAGEGLAGAMVFVKGDDTRNALTLADGAYTINATSQNDVLVFRYLGYRETEVAVAGRRNVDVAMEEDVTVVDDVVVVGYGTQKRQFIVGSVSQVSSKELMKSPATNVSNLLTGKLPGITSIQRSGQPGMDQTSLLVRGTGSYNNTDPLILVDGVERGINTVNPNDVETISVLKDAATSSIYGVRGANGVILVTTKSGSSDGKFTITYGGRAIFTQNTAFPEMLNARDYIGWHNLAREMDGLDPLWTAEAIQTMKDRKVYGETDWLGLLYKPYGFEHQHNISATGGTDRVRYFASIGMVDQGGIVPNSDYRRFNVRSNVDVKVAKNLNLLMNLAGYQTKAHAPGYGLSSQAASNPLQQAIYALPIVAPTYTDPETGKEYPLGYFNGGQPQNPIAAINRSGFNDNMNWKFEGNARLEYDFGGIDALKGLKASVFGAYDFGFNSQRSYMSSYDIMSFDPATLTNPDSTSAALTYPADLGTMNSFSKSSSYSTRIMLRPQLTYSREFGRHNIEGLLLYEQTQYHDDTMTGNKRGYYSSSPVDISIGTTWEGIESNAVSGSYGNTGVASFAGRFSYAFDRKYLAEFSFRADASYKFDPANRWGFFPSVALGWVVSEESFLKDAATPISFLKLRASYGEGGMDDISSYLFVKTYKSSSIWYSSSEPASVNYIFGGKGQYAYRTSNYLHEGLTWSRTRSFNAGFDLALWNGKLDVKFDWFYKLTDKLLEGVGGSYAPSLGGNAPIYANSGRMDNRGFELELRHGDSFANGWSYSVAGSLAWARNKVLSKQINDDHPSNYHAILGKPIGWLYGYKAIGLFQTQEQIDNSPLPPSGGAKRLGDIMYADINGDGVLNSQDHVKIGNSYTPEMNFSLEMNVGWKGVYLNMLWQGVAITSYSLSGAYNHGVTDNTMYTRPWYENGNAPYYIVENAWREDNTNAKYPRLSTQASTNNANYSSWWVKNGAYLRLKTLTLGYQLPQRFMGKSGIDGINVFVSGRNLLTFTEFKYVDPEMPSVNNGYYPQQRTFSIGVDLTF